jgi:hypothetical protein
MQPNKQPTAAATAAAGAAAAFRTAGGCSCSQVLTLFQQAKGCLLAILHANRSQNMCH